MTTLPPPASPPRIEEACYDQVPYDSFAFGQSQPSRLAALAHLFGLEAPPIATARVLELGCASGGNLIPLARRFPAAHFTGLDLSSVQIGLGQERCKALGLVNITLRQADLSAAGAVEGRFDYIVCHGVYSWVPQDVRDAILRICGQNLSADGIAYVSYNTYPGWYQMGAVRDLMRDVADGIDDPAERVRAARTALQDMAAAACGQIAPLYADQASKLDGYSDFYLHHEHLEPVNVPVYFRDFAAHAQAHGLAYLTDILFQLGIPELWSARIGELARAFGGDDVIRTEHYLDLATGRRYRETLLVHADRAPLIQRRISAGRLDALHLRLTTPPVAQQPAVPSAANSLATDNPVFAIAADTLAPRSAAARRALEHLATATNHEATFTVADLTARVHRADEPGPDTAEEVRHVVLTLLQKMALRLYLEPVACTAAGEHPTAHPDARADAAAGQAFTTSPFHDHIKLDDTDRRLLPLLDGTRDRAMLEQALTAANTEAETSSQPTLEDLLKTLAKRNLLIA